MTEPTEPRPNADSGGARNARGSTGKRSATQDAGARQTSGRQREPGYRGSLPTRDDRLARQWILTVLGIFLLIIVLSVAGVPSRFVPDPTPLPTLPPAPSVSADASTRPSSDASGSTEPSASQGPTGSPSGEPSADASGRAESSEASPSP